MLAAGLLFFFAIRRSPVGKMILLAVALLPLTLQEAETHERSPWPAGTVEFTNLRIRD